MTLTSLAKVRAIPENYAQKQTRPEGRVVIQSNCNGLLPPVVDRFVLNDRFAAFNEGLTVAVVRPHRHGTASDHQNDHAVHDLTKGFAVASENVPLHGQTIQTDHAVQFGSHQEDKRPDQTVMVGVNRRKVGANGVRVEQHRGDVREDHARQDHSGHDLDDPKGGVAVSDELVLALDVVEHTIARRETTQGHQSVDDHQEGDSADQSDVHPSMFFTVKDIAAGEGNQVPEHILAQLDGARESHVAEQEQAEQQARHGLGDVAVGRPSALALGVAQFHTSDDFFRRRGVGIFFLIRGIHRHDEI